MAPLLEGQMMRSSSFMKIYNVTRNPKDLYSSAKKVRAEPAGTAIQIGIFRKDPYGQAGTAEGAQEDTALLNRPGSSVSSTS